MADCTLIKHPDITRPIIMMKLLRPRVAHCHPLGEVFENIEPLDMNRRNPLEMEQGERQISKESEATEEQAPRPSNRKRKRENYDADNEDSDAQSQHQVKKRRTYVIPSESDEKSKKTKDDIGKDPNYCTEEEIKKEESMDSNTKLQEEE